MIFSIQDKVILITGATGYLGSAMTRDLSLALAKVIVCSTSMKKALTLCDELNLSPDQAYTLDITDKNSIENTLNSILQKYGKIDVLVNNAYFGCSKKFGEYEDSEWFKSFDGTVVAVDKMTQAVIPYLKQSGNGRIINITSMYGLVAPNPDVYPDPDMINPIAYGVGKAGIIQYTKYSAMQLAKDKITVNCISYGPFPNINNVKDDVFLENLAKKTMLKKIGKPEEVSSAVFFLSLDESSYITGQNIVVDGGWTAW